MSANFHYLSIGIRKDWQHIAAVKRLRAVSYDSTSANGDRKKTCHRSFGIQVKFVRFYLVHEEHSAPRRPAQRQLPGENLEHQLSAFSNMHLAATCQLDLVE